MLKPLQAHETKALTSSTSSTINVPVGGKLHNIILRFSTGAGADVTEAAIRSEIGNIRLTLNGKDLVNASAIKLLDLYEVLGLYVGVNAGVASVVELNLGKLAFVDPAVRDLFGLGTADVQSIQITVTAGTLATIANVQAFTSREQSSEKLGMYCKFINYPISFNSTGDHTVDTLPRDPDSRYLLTMLDSGASGTLTFGECRVNNINIYDRTPIAVYRQCASNARFQTPTGYLVYLFGDGNLATSLPMVNVNDLRFINTFSVAPGAAGYNMSNLTLVNVPAAVGA